MYAISITRAFFYITIPIFLLILPSDYFDSEDESICLSVRILNEECYACGMTSAMMHLIHFEFETAFAYNAISFLAFPPLAILWALWFLTDVKFIKKYSQESKKNEPAMAKSNSTHSL
jgi:hypothetical protein